MSQSTKEILRTWNAALKGCGFRLTGSLARREVGILEHSVGFQRSQRVAPGKIRINLYISIRDNFLDPADLVLCLRGRVTNKAATFNDDESFWEEGQLVRSGLESFLSHGIGWFERFGKDAGVLAGWLEKALAAKASVKDMIGPTGSAHPEIEAMIAPYLNSGTQKAPAIYERFLSLLRFDQGHLASACGSAQAYLESLNRGEVAFPQEPERTLRQLRKMGCSEVKDSIQTH